MLRTSTPATAWCQLCKDRPLRAPWEHLSQVCDLCFDCPLTDGERRLLHDIQHAPDLPEIDPEEDDEERGGEALVSLVALVCLAFSLTLFVAFCR